MIWRLQEQNCKEVSNGLLGVLCPGRLFDTETLPDHHFYLFHIHLIYTYCAFQ